jgi:hypothetical protein
VRSDLFADNVLSTGNGEAPFDEFATLLGNTPQLWCLERLCSLRTEVDIYAGHEF